MTRDARAAKQVVELAFATPAVVAMRTATFMAHAGAPRVVDVVEATRMVTEKWQAFGEAWLAIALVQQRACAQWWLACMRPAPGVPRGAQVSSLARRMHRANVAAFARGLVPIHRTATANVRRLGRRSR